MFQKLVIIVVLVSSVISCSRHERTNEEILADAFFASCYRFAGDKAGFQNFLKGKKVAALPDNNSKYFLKGRSGEAWGANISGNKIVLTWLQNDTCSFFINSADVDLFISEVNSKLNFARDNHGAIFEPSQFEVGLAEPRAMQVTLLKSNNPNLKEGVVIHLSASKDASKNLAVMLSTSLKNG